jgi:hypothetical protein
LRAARNKAQTVLPILKRGCPIPRRAGTVADETVITDYLMIEALKDDPLNKIFPLMKVLCQYPKQVVVLKSMRSLTALKGRRCGMTRRMIDRDQTKGFGAWCAGLDKAEAGDKNYRGQLVEAGNDATEQMSQIIAAQSTYAKVIEDEAKKLHRR